MIACRVLSARGPNSRAAGTTRSVSWEIGACQNGRKAPGHESHPQGLPQPGNRPGEQPAVDAEDSRAGGLEGQVHVRVRQDRLRNQPAFPRRSQRRIQ